MSPTPSGSKPGVPGGATAGAATPNASLGGTTGGTSGGTLLASAPQTDPAPGARGAPGRTRPIAFLMGSDSDLATIEGALALLDELGVGYHVRVLSAHRTPEETAAFARDADRNGVKVLIGVAGLAAHLAGTLAAHSLLPVLGVPAGGGPLQGHDALLSTVMMPPGVPVGTLAIGSAGAKNAALLAVRILALADQDVAARLRGWRAAEHEKCVVKDKAVRERFSC